MANQTTRTILVKGTPMDVYNAWADLESFPTFLKRLKSVTRTGENRTHWVAQGPLGMDVEWDAETTRLEPGRRIAWHSTFDSEVRTSGQVTFNQLPNDLTEVTVTLQHETDTLKGKAGQMLVGLDGVLDEALRMFKAHVEGRVPAGAGRA
jgi:uncharacterized membrane protein